MSTLASLVPAASMLPSGLNATALSPAARSEQVAA
jgi:hypothetical protein